MTTISESGSGKGYSQSYLHDHATDKVSALLFLNRLSWCAAIPGAGSRAAPCWRAARRAAGRYPSCCIQSRRSMLWPQDACRCAQRSVPPDAVLLGGRHPCWKVMGWSWRASRLGGDSFRSSCFSSCATPRRGKPRRSASCLERSRFRLRSPAEPTTMASHT